jgi:putative ABC transport system permease protein
MRRAPGLGLIGLASWLVPEERRLAWRREWEAEATWAWQQLDERVKDRGSARLRLRLRVATCLVDALTEATENVKMTGLGNDLRYALRSLIRKPGFTGVAVLTLSLGIGATTAVFTLLDGVMLSPLPYPSPSRLISIAHQGRDGADELPISPGLYRLYGEQSRTLEGVAMHSSTVGNLVVDGEPERVAGRVVTPSFFDVLGVAPARGRTFVNEEGKPGGAQVIVLSDGLWRTKFGADPGIIGRSIDVNGTARQVVGVMPAGFGFPDAEARFWTPLIVDDANAPLASFGASGIGRMKAEQTIESVRTELQGVLGRLTELAPGGQAEFLQSVNIGARVTSLKESLVGELSTTLWILFATVGIVLLIACANVANLLLVRAEARQRELALRVALGAGRLQLLRAFIGESVAVSAAGAVLGVAVAAAALRLMTGLIPTNLPRAAEIGIDGRVLGFTALIGIGCAVFFGLFPMLRYGMRDLSRSLHGGTRGATGGRERHRLRNGLVISQVALALVLLIGSGLMLRSFMALRAVDPGFYPDNVLTARLSLPTAEIPDWPAVDQFYRQLRQQLEDRPGVSAVGFATAIPLGGGGISYSTIEVEDHPRADSELPIFALWPQAGAGYFEAMGIRVLQGRGFETGDGANGNRAVVVSKAFAEKWWPDTSPIGRGLRLGGPDEDWYRIVGVVDDVRQRDLQEVEQEAVYFPLVLDGGGSTGIARTVDVVIRTSGDPLALVSVLREEIRSLNPRIPISNVRTMASVFEGATSRTSFAAAMLGAASAIALVLGLIGIYGVISYVVSQRTREIGVRMALGASRSVVRGMVVRQGLALSGGGVVLGLAAAVPLSRLMQSMLYGVRPVDPVTYIGVGLSLIAVALVASLIPAMRAAAVEPGRALRID